MAITLPAYTPMFERPQGREISPLATIDGVRTSDVLSSGASEGYRGATSLAANMESYIVEHDTGREQNLFSYGLGAFVFNTGNFIESVFGGGETELDRQPLSKEEWLKSDFYREGIEYKQGLTVRSAKVLQQSHDREETKNFLLSQASGWQTVGFFASALTTSLADAKNIAVGVGAAGVVRGGVAAYSGASTIAKSGGVGVAAKAVMSGRSGRATTAVGASLVRANQAAAASLRGFKTSKRTLLAEAAIGSAVVGASGFEAEAVLGRQYGIEDMALDFIASGVISIGLHKIGGYIGATWLKTSHSEDISAIQKIVEAQVQSGERINVRPAVEAQLAERYVPLSTLSPNNRVPEVTRVGRKKQYTASYQGEQGIYASVKGRGATPEEALADLESIYTTGRVSSEAYNTQYTPEYYQDALVVQDLKDQVSKFDLEAEENAEFARIYGEEYDTALDRIIDLEQEIENLKQTRGKSQVSKAEKRLNAEKKKFDDALKQAMSSVNGRFTSLKKQHGEARDALVDLQKRLAAPQYQQWFKDQLSTDPRGKVAGVDNSNADYQAYVDEANQASNGDPLVSSADDTGEIAGLESMVIDDNISPEFRAMIKEQLNDVNVAKKMPEAYRSYVACMTKG